MTPEAAVEVSPEVGFGRSSWLQRRTRRLVLGAVISGLVLSGITAAVLKSRRKP